ARGGEGGGGRGGGGVGGGVSEVGPHDAPEQEVADRAATMPAREAVVLLEQRRLSRRVVAVEPFEPRDPRMPVPLLSAPLGPVEVRPQLLRVGLREAERS